MIEIQVELVDRLIDGTLSTRMAEPGALQEYRLVDMLLCRGADCCLQGTW